MTGIKQIVVFTLVWILGCVVFDGLLELTGGFLMSAGVATFWIAAWASGLVTVNHK